MGFLKKALGKKLGLAKKVHKAATFSGSKKKKPASAGASISTGGNSPSMRIDSLAKGERLGGPLKQKNRLKVPSRRNPISKPAPTGMKSSNFRTPVQKLSRK